jgi:hypothetical protein
MNGSQAARKFLAGNARAMPGGKTRMAQAALSRLNSK